MNETKAPGVDEISWEVDGAKMADALMDSPAGPTVKEWAKGLERAFFAKTVQLSEEERTRRENLPPSKRVKDELARRQRRQVKP